MYYGHSICTMAVVHVVLWAVSAACPLTCESEYRRLALSIYIASVVFCPCHGCGSCARASHASSRQSIVSSFFGLGVLCLCAEQAIYSWNMAVTAECIYGSLLTYDSSDT